MDSRLIYVKAICLVTFFQASHLLCLAILEVSALSEQGAVPMPDSLLKSQRVSATRTSQGKQSGLA
jgi:hypothetical protein